MIISDESIYSCTSMLPLMSALTGANAVELSVSVYKCSNQRHSSVEKFNRHEPTKEWHYSTTSI